ncbi:hypothetical protein CULT_100024 [[Clostridium] ultunense Esp]|nr:hypothetical protein CULT_100024 [[Clostridium] ultunense Esp]
MNKSTFSTELGDHVRIRIFASFHQPKLSVKNGQILLFLLIAFMFCTVVFSNIHESRIKINRVLIIEVFRDAKDMMEEAHLSQAIGEWGKTGAARRFAKSEPWAAFFLIL